MVSKWALSFGMAAALALVGQDALARGSRRAGGGHSGRIGAGVSRAVARGGGFARGAVARHPRAGVSRFSHSRGFAARPFRYSPRPFYRPFFYRPYRHYSPYFFGAFSFGWPYYGRFGWPYESHVYIYDDGPSYYGGPGYDYGGPGYEVPPDDGRYEADRGSPPDPAARGSRETGRVRLEVRPEDAAIYVDDELWGDASETKFLTLRSGRHVIELVRPGYEAARREVEVERGETSDLLVELRRR